MATVAVNHPIQHPFPAAQATATRARGPIIDPRTKPVPIPSDPRQESVYRLIPIEYTPPAQEKRYRSVFAGQARVDYKSNCQPAASMGPAKVKLHEADDFLKKGDGAKKEKKIVSRGKRDRTVRKAFLTKELGVPIPPPKKDYVKQNALDNINSIAKKTPKHAPVYTGKKDYGVTPEYLKKRIEELKISEQNDAELLVRLEQAKIAREGIIPLPEEERGRILDGLKANWEKLNLDYQRLSLTVDTVPKIARKVNLEQQLQKYEELIDKFSNANIKVNFNSLYDD